MSPEPGLSPGGPTRRVTLGADAWAVLLAAAPGLVLPPPFDAGGVLAPGQADAAQAALRSSPVVVGDTGVLVADLHPSLRAGLLLQLAAPVTVTVAVDDLTARFALAAAPVPGPSPAPAAGLLRTRGGPVTVLALPATAVAGAASELVPGLDAGGPDRRPVRLDAATAVAAAQALSDGRPDLAAALVGPQVPAALGPVSGAARLQVDGPTGGSLLLALRTSDGWRSSRLSDEDVVLSPLDAGTLVTVLAGALGAALVPV